MARILAIDDDPDMRAMIQQTLTSAGHEVILAADGREGVRAARRRLWDKEGHYGSLSSLCQRRTGAGPPPQISSPGQLVPRRAVRFYKPSPKC